MENEEFNQIKNDIDNLLELVIKDIREILLNCDEEDFYDYQTQILEDVGDFEDQIYAIENERFGDSYQIDKKDYIKYESNYYDNE